MNKYVKGYTEHTARATAQGFKALSFPQFVHLVIKIKTHGMNC